MGSGELTEAHPTSSEVAAYLDGELSGPERARLEGHLVQCDVCRQEIVEVVEILRSPSVRPAWRRVAGFAGLAAASIAAVLLFTSRPSEEIRPPGPILRGGETQVEGTPTIGVVAPADGESAKPDGLVFRWRSAGSRGFYRLTLTDENGDVLWSTSTSDTTMALPPGTGLKRGSRYFWYVDALLADGAAATTGVHSFLVAP